MKKYLNKISLVLLLATSASNIEADASGKMIAHACYSCHGEKLIDLSSPLSKIELTRTLLAFKTNNKNSTIMGRIMKGYTETEIKAVATYISSFY